MDIKIDDIANLANVLRGTVDRVLHNRGRVSEKTAAKVRKIIQEMNYQPNSLGRAFAMSQKELKLGVLLTYKEQQFGDQIMSGISEGADLAEQSRSVPAGIFASKITYRQHISGQVK